MRLQKGMRKMNPLLLFNFFSVCSKTVAFNGEIGVTGLKRKLPYVGFLGIQYQTEWNDDRIAFAVDG